MTSLCTELGGLFYISSWPQPCSDFVVYVPLAVKVWRKVKSLQEDITISIV